MEKVGDLRQGVFPFAEKLFRVFDTQGIYVFDNRFPKRLLKGGGESGFVGVKEEAKLLDCNFFCKRTSS